MFGKSHPRPTVFCNHESTVPPLGCIHCSLVQSVNFCSVVAFYNKGHRGHHPISQTVHAQPAHARQQRGCCAMMQGMMHHDDVLAGGWWCPTIIIIPKDDDGNTTSHPQQKNKKNHSEDPAAPPSVTESINQSESQGFSERTHSDDSIAGREGWWEESFLIGTVILELE